MQRTDHSIAFPKVFQPLLQLQPHPRSNLDQATSLDQEFALAISAGTLTK
jgi:hypothetical protein